MNPLETRRWTYHVLCPPPACGHPLDTPPSPATGAAHRPDRQDADGATSGGISRNATRAAQGGAQEPVQGRIDEFPQVRRRLHALHQR